MLEAGVPENKQEISKGLSAEFQCCLTLLNFIHHSNPENGEGVRKVQESHETLIKGRAGGGGPPNDQLLGTWQDPLINNLIEWGTPTDPRVWLIYVQMDQCGVRPLSYLCHRDYSPLGSGGHRKSKQAHLDKRVTRVTGCFPFNSSADSYMHQAMCPQHRPT